MSGLSFMGVGSGLPVADIIGALVKAEAAPLKRLEHDKEYYKSQISGLGQLKSRLSSLQEAMKDLQGLDKFQMLAANTGNEKLFTATADHAKGATAANYNIEVLAEAKNYRHVSGPLSTANKFTNPGTLTFKAANGTDDLKDKDGNVISINTENKTLDEIRAEINSHEGLKGKLSASIVNESGTSGRLVLNSAVSGEEGRFTANFSNTAITKDADLSSKDTATENLNAHIKIDGIDAYSSTNKFENVISGVSINVTAGAMNETNKAAALEVKRDDEAIKNNIDAFVKSYNDVIIHLNEAKKGSLYGDNTIRSIETELRNILYEPTKSITGTDKDTQKNFLAMIGIEVYTEKSYDPENPSSRNGTLEIDSAKLTEALDEDFDRVAHILGATNDDPTKPQGYAQRLDKLATDLISGGVRDGKIYKGLLEIRTEGLNKQVKRIDERVESTNMRLELLEQRLVKQFSSIDGLVANLNAMGSFISQQINGLPGYTK